MWLLFRDDDLGWQPKAFARLLTLFARYDQKLNAAAIPYDLNEKLIQESIPYSYQAAPFLQVVTHGYRHLNYQIEGKKSEFGSDRSAKEVLEDLKVGKKILQENFENYFPCFVPPWNRIDDSFIPLLKEAGYLMLSRNDTESPFVQSLLPEFNVSMDLHTNKIQKLQAKEAFSILSKKYEQGEEFTGVMLHHANMTEEDFEILEDLLKELRKRNIFSCFYSDLIPGFERRTEIEVGHV
jgi:peptidoglycan/xylan/chitin deacetylase (PgdA/CDA1 family)